MTDTMVALLIIATAVVVLVARSALVLSGHGGSARPAAGPSPVVMATAAAPAWPVAEPAGTASAWSDRKTPEGAGPAEGVLHLMIWKVAGDGTETALSEPLVLANITDIGADSSSRLVLPAIDPAHLIVRRIGPKAVLVRDLNDAAASSTELTVDQPLTVSGFRLEIF